VSVCFDYSKLNDETGDRKVAANKCNNFGHNAAGNIFSGMMKSRQTQYTDRMLCVAGGAIFLVVGIIAYITDMYKVGAIILVTFGIGGIIIAFRRPGSKDIDS